MTRKSPEEQEGGSVSKRVLIMSGQMNVPGLMELVKKEAEQNYKRVDVIDIDEHLNAFKHYKEPKKSELIKEEIQKVLAQLFKWVTDPNLEPPLPTFDEPKTCLMVLKERMEELFIKYDDKLPTWSHVYKKMHLERQKNNKNIIEADLLELRKFFDELIAKDIKV
nr:hypothetical protein [Chlorokybus atmophyticus]WKT05650.1 hypothetical protein [Chlorokybus atmophyticus]